MSEQASGPGVVAKKSLWLAIWILALVALIVKPAVATDDDIPLKRASASERIASRESRKSPVWVRSYWTRQRMLSARAPEWVFEADARLMQSHSSTQNNPSYVEERPPRVTLEAGEQLTASGTEHLARQGPIPYSRFEIADNYQTFPYSTVGKVFAVDSDGVGYVCSATALNSDNLSVVWTAAHCVFGPEPGQTWAAAFNFVPAYKDGQAPLGEWPFVEAFVPQGWVDERSPGYDIAALVVAPDLQGNRLVEVVGGRGIAWGLPRNQTFQSFGYPAAAPFDGERMISCVSTYGGGGDPEGSGPPLMAMGCDMGPGSSGGGWIIQDEYLNSNVSGGYPELPEVQFGPYLNQLAGDIFQAASTLDSTEPAPPPTVETHKMRLSIRLKGHLVARGTMSATDGYEPCTREARILILRKKTDGWKVVKRGWTNNNGRYSVTLADKQGKYFAFSPAGSVDDLNKCTKSSSIAKKHRH